MQIAGKERVPERFVDVSEATIVCDVDDLKRLAELFATAYEETAAFMENGQTGTVHWHYQDLDASWRIGQADLVIVSLLGDETGR